MIELIEGLPDNVVGLVARGRVTKRDCADVLLPAIDKALEWHYRLRLYYEIRTRFPGAGWDDTALGARRAVLWERIAIVTDTAWVRQTVTALRLLVPGETRVFATSQIPEGLAWITGATPRRRRPAAVAASVSPAGRDHGFEPALQYLRQML